MPKPDTFFLLWTVIAVVFFLFILLMPKRISQFIPGRRRSKKDQEADDRRIRAFYAQEKVDIWNKRGLTPFEILGVGRGAGRAEIEKAFKRRIKQYHPDKVLHLGVDYVNIAKERTILITNARAELLKKLDRS
ncbi:MAG: hypothetical protein A3F16_00645 [Deltaproteobacteria bacterium RIFCSPHIGHO2_12_FULL_43_9]|nr:MAG: hypothetical protein A3F16_00645 [Deltaproteobacteria bacterium RIFCSPHIGHO2_12_FULL_43_9]